MGWWPFSSRRKAVPGVETPPASHAGPDSEHALDALAYMVEGWKRHQQQQKVAQWTIGDIAECLAPNWFTALGDPIAGPGMGDRLKVCRVVRTPFDSFLWFGSRFGEQLFASKDFRKVEPRADAINPATAEFVAMISKTKS